jgi:hypothetical protein
MKRILLVIVTLVTTLCAYSQALHQVIFNNGESIKGFSFLTDQGIIIRISDEGKLLQWGVEPELRRYNYVPGQLDQYMGRVDYYGTEADSISKGKVKSIGTCMINYYGAYEQAEKIGKIRSLGSVQLDYYSNYDNAAYRGKLRSANNQQFSYYSSFDNDMVRGKLKSVNNTPIVYYTSFDDKLVRGKVKTIGNFSYNWYTSFDRREYQGNLKTGSFSQYINGITYLLSQY